MHDGKAGFCECEQCAQNDARYVFAKMARYHFASAFMYAFILMGAIILEIIVASGVEVIPESVERTRRASLIALPALGILMAVWSFGNATMHEQAEWRDMRKHLQLKPDSPLVAFFAANDAMVLAKQTLAALSSVPASNTETLV
jgi:hypothetical protein